MELQHTFTVPIGIDEAWAAFTDIERIAPCLPGAVITSVDGDSFAGTAKVKLGPIALQYSGRGTWVSRDEATYAAVIDAQGKDKRGNGTAGAVIRARLEPLGGGGGGGGEAGSSTTVVLDTELKITGRPAQFGRGVIQDVGTQILDQFAACLATRLAPDPAPSFGAGPSDPEPTAATSAPASAPTSAPASAPTSAPASAPTSAPTAVEPDPPPLPIDPPAEPAELDLGNVVGSVLLKRLRPVVAGAAVVGVIIWLIARR
jgi:uncharacterized protein